MRHLTEEHKKAMGEAIRKKWLTYSEEKKEKMKANQRKAIAEKEGIIKIWERIIKNKEIQEMIIKEISKDNNK